jgi:DNA polymerase (family 10)
MSNKELARHLRLLSALMELHEENPFKIKSVQNAAFQIDRSQVALHELDEAGILAMPGVGKSIATKLIQLLAGNTDPELDALLQKTPVGVVEMLGIKGIGPKKVAQLWKELEIESPGELLYACNENRLVELKGFGVKTQELIKSALEFRFSNSGKMLFADADYQASLFEDHLRTYFPKARIERTGALRREENVVDRLSFLAAALPHNWKKTLTESGFSINTEGMSIVVNSTEGLVYYLYECAEENWGVEQIKHTGPDEFVETLMASSNVSSGTTSEEAVFASLNQPFVIPALRNWPFEKALELSAKPLAQLSDIRGILHNHSTWSDGADTLKTMADACKAMGMAYFGICDHSKSAFYAGGLSAERVLAQHKEIDELNKAYPVDEFRIFKGIESDILNDGSLDYPTEILEQFDFIVASVHSVLRMDEQRATSRLIKAIENPHTTILGHPSGRLLLSRAAYPLDYPKIIDACAANKVAIELNANPYRLDIDWQWIPLCMEKGVMISVNPDAHRKEGLADIAFGMKAARKGGLRPDFLLNGLEIKDFTKYLQLKK